MKWLLLTLGIVLPVFLALRHFPRIEWRGWIDCRVIGPVGSLVGLVRDLDRILR